MYVNLNHITFIESVAPSSRVAELICTVTNTAAAMLDIYQTQARFSGNVTNYGTVKVTGPSTVTFLGTYTEYGAYISDPSKTYFTNLTIESPGYLKGSFGDEFYISGNFINNS